MTLTGFYRPLPLPPANFWPGRWRGVHLAANQVANRLAADETGVVVTTASGAQYRAAMVFVAIGRFPDLSRLNLAAVGLPVPAGQTMPTEKDKSPDVSNFLVERSAR